MGSIFGGGGGGGKPPKPPTLQQVDVSQGGPLVTESSAIGNEWANLMRTDYGFQPGGPAWRAPLGRGVLAMMQQADYPTIGAQDPQVTAALDQGFGRNLRPNLGGGDFGGGGAGVRDWNLGSDPYQVSQNLGQQFRSPLGQLQRNQNFLNTLQEQWPPPQLQLTGADLMNVAVQNAIQRGQNQQQFLQSQIQGETQLAAAQAGQSARTLGSFGTLGSAIANFYNPQQQNFYQPPIYSGFSSSGYGAFQPGTFENAGDYTLNGGSFNAPSGGGTGSG